MTETVRKYIKPFERNMANQYFFILMILSWAVSLLPPKILYPLVDDLALNSVLSELMIVVPALLLSVIWLIVQSYKESTADDYTAPLYSDRFIFRSVKISTLLMSILYMVVLTPVYILFNAISMLFVDNTMLEYSAEMLSMSPASAVFFTAALPAFCEEFAFRGMIYGGYRKNCTPLGAVLMSSLLFGLMHLNINQFFYAFVIGISLAILVEATGSIWPSILSHFCINARAVISMFIADSQYEGIFEDYLEEGISADSLYPTIALYAAISVGSVIIAGVIISRLSKIEGRPNPLRMIAANRMYKATRSTVWNIFLITGVIAAIVYIVLIELI